MPTSCHITSADSTAVYCIEWSSHLLYVSLYCCAIFVHWAKQLYEIGFVKSDWTSTTNIDFLWPVPPSFFMCVCSAYLKWNEQTLDAVTLNLPSYNDLSEVTFQTVLISKVFFTVFCTCWRKWYVTFCNSYSTLKPCLPGFDGTKAIPYKPNACKTWICYPHHFYVTLL